MGRKLGCKDITHVTAMLAKFKINPHEVQLRAVIRLFVCT